MNSASNRQKTFADTAPVGRIAPDGGVYEYVQAETPFSGDEANPFAGLMPPVNAGEF